MASIAAVLALAGCGGKATTTSAPATAGTHPDAPPPAHADGNPRGALIGAADLSASWTAQPPAPVGLACGGWDPLRGATKRLDSPRFNRESSYLQQTLAVFADARASSRAYRRLNSAATQRCTRRALREYLRSGSGAGFAFVTSPSVVRIESLGDHSHGLRYAAQVNGELGRGDAYIVAINSRIGRATASLTVVTGLSQLAEAAYEQLAAAAERHLEAVYG